MEAEKGVARERTAADETAAAALRKERAELAGSVAPAVRQLYERIRKGRRGVAVAEAVDGRCSACNLTLRPQLSQDLKRGEEIVSCESCQRILYYNPPAAVEDLAGEAAPAARQ